MTLLLVLAGGAAGAPLRYLLDRWVTAWAGGPFPWGTLVVNVSGSFALGMLAAGAPGWMQSLAGVGLCGALTTFSTFGFESVRLLEQGRTVPAMLNVVGSLGVGLCASGLGWWLGG